MELIELPLGARADDYVNEAMARMKDAPSRHDIRNAIELATKSWGERVRSVYKENIDLAFEKAHEVIKQRTGNP